jgi:CheY-like chemotaxis protein
MSLPKILIWQPHDNGRLIERLSEEFSITCTSSQEETLQLASEGDVKALVADFSLQEPLSLGMCKGLFDEEGFVANLPLIILSSSHELRHKLEAFEQGCDDYIEPGTCVEEVAARINKSIFHKIASEQLKDRLELANATAYSVMSDNSDLGANIQFLLDANRCSNLDQLGQLFFSAIQRYGISASLQMRSLYQVKNMEANGMAKDLESQLLTQMQDAGRYVDFGRRTIMNYGQCSLLVRNMPVNDEVRYGAIKDNTFALIQGVDARIKALDDHQKLLDEKAALHKLSQSVKEVMTEIDESYQSVMRDIVSTVEDMADSIQSRIPVLALSEEQESFFEGVSESCVSETNRIFNQGLKVDESFQNLSEAMEKALHDVDFLDDEPHDPLPPVTDHDASDADDGVELF